MIRRMMLGFLATLSGTTLFAADWPQWRGPNRDGKSGDTGLLKSWPAGGPKLVWKSDDVGTGYGSPAVIGDRLYLIGGSTAKKDSKDSLTCLNAKDGSQVWTKEFGASAGNYLDQWGGGPRGTPTVDGDMIYVLGATGDLACMKASNGDIVWSTNLVKEYGGAIPKWGYSESVLIDGDLLLCTPGNKTPMLALNKKTGKKVWACEGIKDDTGYSSIMIAMVGNTKVYCQQSMKQAYGVGAKGDLLWNAGEIGRATAVIPSPVVMGSDIFYTSGYGAGCELIQLEAASGGVKATVKYKSKSLANHHGGVIEFKGMIFGHSDRAGWTMLDPKDGKEKWVDKGVDKGSVSFADGHFYCYSENKGECALVKADTAEYKEVSKFTIPEKSKSRPGQGKVWPHPVIANGRLYLRDFEKLFVFDVKGSAE